MRNYKKQIMIVLLVVIVIYVGFIWWSNTTLMTTHISVKSNRLPKQFDGFTIAHISDFHNAEYGEDNNELLQIVKEENPDMIAVTGDLIDSRDTDTTIAIDFMKQALDIAPCFYVIGNHETRLGNVYTDMENQLLDLGVTILHNEMTLLTKQDASIQIIGLDDPDLYEGDTHTQSSIMEQTLSEIHHDDRFTLLLSHRPELIDVYAKYDMDLVLSGHAHGGQIRLPFAGGLVAPNQGFFPKYDAGKYKVENTQMIVSRGIGNSIIPIRIHNQPEVVIVKLER